MIIGLCPPAFQSTTLISLMLVTSSHICTACSSDRPLSIKVSTYLMYEYTPLASLVPSRQIPIRASSISVYNSALGFSFIKTSLTRIPFGILFLLVFFLDALIQHPSIYYYTSMLNKIQSKSYRNTGIRTFLKKLLFL